MAAHARGWRIHLSGPLPDILPPCLNRHSGRWFHARSRRPHERTMPWITLAACSTKCQARMAYPGGLLRVAVSTKSRLEASHGTTVESAQLPALPSCKCHGVQCACFHAVALLYAQPWRAMHCTCCAVDLHGWRILAPRADRQVIAESEP